MVMEGQEARGIERRVEVKDGIYPGHVSNVNVRKLQVALNDAGNELMRRQCQRHQDTTNNNNNNNYYKNY